MHPTSREPLPRARKWRRSSALPVVSALALALLAPAPGHAGAGSATASGAGTAASSTVANATVSNGTVASGTGAAGITIVCPPALVETPVVSSLLPGWEVDVHGGRRTLSDAAIHVSRGSERADVPPDSTAPSGPEERAWWLLPPGDGRVYWVACSYGNTSALLLQRIPDTARRCVATHDVLKSGRHLNVQPVHCL